MTSAMGLRNKIELYVDRSIRDGGLAGKALLLLREAGITTCVRKHLVYSQYAKERKLPSDTVRKNRAFYRDHQQEVKRNISLLEDETSKKIYKKMIQFRCSHDVRKMPEYCIKNMYFVEGIVPHETDGVFVDCGAFIGDTIKEYARYNQNKYRRLVCFEPDRENYDALMRRIRGNDKAVVYPFGVWNNNGVLSFVSGSGAGSKVDQTKSETGSENLIEIKAVALDSVEECKDATFIKMDIEGAEYEALEGAKGIITTNRPVLAICIYHSNDDMIRIIPWVHSLDLGYKLYVRQHGFDEFDTVLYAIP